MRVRTGFVSNSSSTSYLILSRGDLDEMGFLELMGVPSDSPIARLFQELFQRIVVSSQYVDLANVAPEDSLESWFDGERLSPTMEGRLREAAQLGLKAYYGKISSDDSPVLSFFCTDAFEEENERIYFNYLECVW